MCRRGAKAKESGLLNQALKDLLRMTPEDIEDYARTYAWLRSHGFAIDSREEIRARVYAISPEHKELFEHYVNEVYRG